MKDSARLEIHFDASIDTFDELTTILGVQPSVDVDYFPGKSPSCWRYEAVENKTDEYFDFINIFLDILETKYTELERLNIKRDDITVWMFYEYDKQCNMEFDPERLKRLGDNGISLCISCWDSGK